MRASASRSDRLGIQLDGGTGDSTSRSRSQVSIERDPRPVVCRRQDGDPRTFRRVPSRPPAPGPGRTRLAAPFRPRAVPVRPPRGPAPQRGSCHMTAQRIKITYATLRADNEELHALYEAGLEKAKGRLGQYHRNFIDGAERDGEGTFEVRSPIDTEIVVGTFAKGTRKDAQDAIAAARRAQPAWFRLGWEKRIEILRHAAELISER